MRIQGFNIKNFSNIKNLTIGKMAINRDYSYPIGDVTVFIGEPGSGKSEILRTLNFFLKCITGDVYQAAKMYDATLLCYGKKEESLKKWRENDPPPKRLNPPIFTIIFENYGGLYEYQLCIQPDYLGLPYISYERLNIYIDKATWIPIFVSNYKGDIWTYNNNNKTRVVPTNNIKALVPRTITALKLLGALNLFDILKEQDTEASIFIEINKLHGSEFFTMENPDANVHPSELQQLAFKCAKNAPCFLVTNRPSFLNHFGSESVWVIKKNNERKIEAKRASENSRILCLEDEGNSLGDLWNRGHFSAMEK